jgi:hypothetical protein
MLPAKPLSVKTPGGKTKLKVPILPGTKRPARAGRAAAAPVQAESGEPAEKPDLAGLRGQVIALVRQMVENAEHPVLLARASQFVVNKLGSMVLQTQWAGAGTFKRLLQTSGDLGLEITTQPEPGYILDPRRHARPVSREPVTTAEVASLPGESEAKAEAGVEAMAAFDEANAEEAIFDTAKAGTGDYPGHFEAVGAESLPGAYAGVPYEDDEEDELAEDESETDYEESLPSLEEFARRVGQVTGAPDLTPQQYALVLRGIVTELREIASGEKSYNTYQSSETISEWCAEQGEPVGRGDVVLILKWIIFQDGVRFSKRPGSYTAEELAAITRKNIKALCRRSRMELSEYEERLLDEWILGGLEDEK